MKIFNSPSTKHLLIDFRAYIIELICLNIDKNLGERFWKEKEWADKFRREIAGFSRFVKLYPDYKTDKMLQSSIIFGIQKIRCKSLLSNGTRNRLHAVVDNHYNQSKIINVPIDPKQNARFISTGPKTKLTRIREIQNG